MNALVSGMFLAVFSIAAPAQESKKIDCLSSSACVIRLRDDSCLRVVILQEDIKVATKYGELTIPFAEVKRIEFGFHCPLHLEKEIYSCIGSLSSQNFKERAYATKRLVEIGYFAYPFLKKTAGSKSDKDDLERTKRAAMAIERLQEKLLPRLLSINELDVVYAKEFKVVGRVKGVALKVRSQYLGEITLDFSGLCAIYGELEDQKIDIDAVRYGSSPDQWLNTKVELSHGIRLVVTAAGQVDLWPQGPGQYMTGPKGYTSAGRGSSFMAGTLIGRIGENGKTFVIGEHFEGTLSEGGQLFLQIAPSPWNNASSGSYRTRITTSHIAH